MNKTALLEDFAAALEQGNAHLLSLSEVQASTPKQAGKWSPKQIIGHLTDSAFNNHQRFVRAQIAAHLKNGVLELAGYAQDDWVRVGGYNAQPIADVLELWLAVNRQMIRVILHTPDTALETPIKIGGGEAVTLEFLMVDYVRHLKHHLGQL